MEKGKGLTVAQRRFLEDIFGDDALFTPEQTHVFGADASRRFAPPLAVVRPGRLEQVQELLRWAQRERVALYPRARGTNLVGDCVPDPPGVAISTLKLNRILDVDGKDFVAVVEPGVITAEFQAQVEAQGLFYPPDPASTRISTLGGNVSTCAGGMRALKYGVTRDYVLGLEAVLPGGETIHLGGRAHKNVVGLDLVRLFVGAEGTLGVITQLTLKLLPKPEASASLLACFESLAAALDAVAAVFQAGILPAALEFMDHATLDCLARLKPAPWPASARAALLFRLDGGRATLAAEVERIESALEPHCPSFIDIGLDSASEARLWELRQLINPAAFQLKPDKLSDDVAVPRGSIRLAVEAAHAIAAAQDLVVLVFGHVGDGNLHVNFMYDASIPAELQAVHAAMNALLDATLALGGTISGEHGVGLAKLAYLDKQLPRLERRLMQQVKAVFDPYTIMNPGKAY